MMTTGIFWASFGNLPGQNLMRKIVPDYFWLRLSDQLYSDRPTETLRITQWLFCLNMTKERPFLGWGIRNFSPIYEAKTGIYLGHPHNLFLMFSAETGVLGVLGLLAIVGWVFWQAVKTIQNLSKTNQKQTQLILFTYVVAFSAFTLFNLVDVSIFDLRNNALGWFLLSCISGLVSSLDSVEKIC